MGSFNISVDRVESYESRESLEGIEFKQEQFDRLSQPPSLSDCNAIHSLRSPIQIVRRNGSSEARGVIQGNGVSLPPQCEAEQRALPTHAETGRSSTDAEGVR